MDIFDEELVAFWTALHSCNVKYIMVGGVAANLHGYIRSTDDIDVWLEDTLENRSNFRKAFKKYSGVDYFMFERMQIIPGWTSFNLNNAYKLDLMTGMKGLEDFSFDECFSMATEAEILNLKVPFLHINHLIANKKAVNRPKDQLDIIYLEKIKKLREEEGL